MLSSRLVLCVCSCLCMYLCMVSMRVMVCGGCLVFLLALLLLSFAVQWHLFDNNTTKFFEKGICQDLSKSFWDVWMWLLNASRFDYNISILFSVWFGYWCWISGGLSFGWPVVMVRHTNGCLGVRTFKEGSYGHKRLCSTGCFNLAKGHVEKVKVQMLCRGGIGEIGLVTCYAAMAVWIIWSLLLSLYTFLLGLFGFRCTKGETNTQLIDLIKRFHFIRFVTLK